VNWTRPTVKGLLMPIAVQIVAWCALAPITVHFNRWRTRATHGRYCHREPRSIFLGDMCRAGGSDTPCVRCKVSYSQVHDCGDPLDNLRHRFLRLFPFTALIAVWWNRQWAAFL